MAWILLRFFHSCQKPKIWFVAGYTFIEKMTNLRILDKPISHSIPLSNFLDSISFSSITETLGSTPEGSWIKNFAAQVLNSVPASYSSWCFLSFHSVTGAWNCLHLFYELTDSWAWKNYYKFVHLTSIPKYLFDLFMLNALVSFPFWKRIIYMAWVDFLLGFSRTHLKDSINSAYSCLMTLCVSVCLRLDSNKGYLITGSSCKLGILSVLCYKRRHGNISRTTSFRRIRWVRNREIDNIQYKIKCCHWNLNRERSSSAEIQAPKIWRRVKFLSTWYFMLNSTLFPAFRKLSRMLRTNF